MASVISAEFQVLPTSYETPTSYEHKVRSTALAHRFMVRRSLAQFRGAVSAESQTPSPRVLIRTLKAPLPPT
jgi:hypothetical protein